MIVLFFVPSCITVFRQIVAFYSTSNMFVESYDLHDRSTSMTKCPLNLYDLIRRSVIKVKI